MDHAVEAEMGAGIRVSRILDWPKPYDASVMNYTRKNDIRVLYSGGFGMGYYWEIHYDPKKDEYSWVDLDACGGYEITAHTSKTWADMQSYANRIVGRYVDRYAVRSRKARPPPLVKKE